MRYRAHACAIVWHDCGVTRDRSRASAVKGGSPASESLPHANLSCLWLLQHRPPAQMALICSVWNMCCKSTQRTGDFCADQAVSPWLVSLLANAVGAEGLLGGALVPGRTFPSQRQVERGLNAPWQRVQGQCGAHSRLGWCEVPPLWLLLCHVEVLDG
jgi:hypothetical protein